MYKFNSEIWNSIKQNRYFLHNQDTGESCAMGKVYRSVGIDCIQDKYGIMTDPTGCIRLQHFQMTVKMPTGKIQFLNDQGEFEKANRLALESLLESGKVEFDTIPEGLEDVQQIKEEENRDRQPSESLFR